MTEAGSNLVLRAGAAEAHLDAGAGGRLVALREGGTELIKSSGLGPMSFGLYPMVPWAGRLRDGVLRWRGRRHTLPTHLAPPHAIHGTLLETAWTVTAASATSVEMTAPLGVTWPFGGRAIQRVELAPGVLRVALTVLADADEFPAIVGWHPWFPRQLRSADGAPFGGPVELDLAAGGMLLRGDDHLPTGEVVRPIPPGPWDDCFVDVARPPTLRWPGAMELAIESDAPYWVCYTEPPDAICVEPETGPPNGLNTGEHAVVAPGVPLVASMTMRWRRLR